LGSLPKKKKKEKKTIETEDSFTNTYFFSCFFQSEIDFEVKQEEIDLGIDTEFQDSLHTEASADLDDNINGPPKGIGKATAFMLTLAKRANRGVYIFCPTLISNIEEFGVL